MPRRGPPRRSGASRRKGVVVMGRIVSSFGLAAALALSVGAAHVEASDRLALRGFGGAAFAEAGNDGRWAEAATKDGDFGNYDLALNLAAQPWTRLGARVQGYVGHDLRGEKVSLDYAFAEYAQSSAFKLRGGKVLTPFGLYSEIYDVGTLRPFYYLPQFYEGRLGLVPKAYLGGGITGVGRLGGDWELGYDAFGGQMRFAEFTTSQLNGFDPATGLPIIQEDNAQLVGSKMVGGRLLLASPARGFDIGGSVFYIGDLKQQTAEGRVPFTTGPDATFVNGRLQYQRGRFVARAELFEVYTKYAGVQSFYAEVSQRFFKHWQLALQYEKSDLSLLPGDESVPPPMRRHESLGGALNFWVKPSLVVKLNLYHVDGNLLTRPANAIVSYLTHTLQTQTNVLVLGTQFSF
jgi:hypothetical protein